MSRLAVISGGGTGIGAAIARALMADGFDVAVIGRRPEPLESVKGAQAIQADLRDPAALAGVAEALGDREVDALVNNAGGYIGRSTDDIGAVARQWQETFDTNVMTAVLLTEALLPRLRRPGGRILAFSSIAAQRGGPVPTRPPRRRCTAGYWTWPRSWDPRV